MTTQLHLRQQHFDCPCVCVCFTNRRANWTLGILVDVVCTNLGDCMCVPRMNSNLHEQQRWILGIFFGSPLLVQHIAAFSTKRKDMWWSHSAVQFQQRYLFFLSYLCSCYRHWHWLFFCVCVHTKAQPQTDWACQCRRKDAWHTKAMKCKVFTMHIQL